MSNQEIIDHCNAKIAESIQMYTFNIDVTDYQAAALHSGKMQAYNEIIELLTDNANE